MQKIVKKITILRQKSLESIKAEGLLGFAQRSARFVYYRQFPHKRKKEYKDILFINGCLLPSEQYRVQHPMEQLAMCGLSSDVVYYEQLDLAMLKYYRGFIFFRCPVTDTVRGFINRAKLYNKTCFFDIDDLVIDKKYTRLIDYVNNMPADEKAIYDDGVNRMRETLELCDHAITTTERMQEELKNYTKGDVFINRNVASDEMVKRALDALAAGKNKDDSKVIIGYYSGSITHNEDFEMIQPAVVKLMKKHKNVYLQVTGILDIPKELQEFAGRIIRTPFLDWRGELFPSLVNCDINLAPITRTIFNDAKSENKWILASLAKTVTVASNFGAFKAVMQHGTTGILVDDDNWFEALDDLVRNKDKRERLGEAAFKRVLEAHTTLSAAHEVGAFIRSRLKRNIAFVLPSTDISGGVNVVLKHAEILRKYGWDVTLIDAIDKRALKESLREYNYRLDLPGYNVITDNRTVMCAHFDTMVATLWATVDYVKKYPNVTNRVYLVQNFETDFYGWGGGKPRFMAHATYNDETGLRYVTISLWCKEWLKKFGKEARYASNGLDLDNFPQRKRDFKGKVQILIEGDSRSEYKNTDEAFRIVQKLDPKMYEVSYLSYRKEPKPWYRVDHFYNRIPYEEVGEIYAKCDILIKTSLVESFSYPPLEMMATGGLAVVVPNGGNAEYLRDGYNCLLYRQGDIDDGVSKVEKLVTDKKLRDRLIKNGLETAKKYAWEAREKDILALYE